MEGDNNNSIDAHALHELKLLEHVSEQPTLSNREAARILGVSVKLSHQILSRMISKGLFHVTKHHARRWDYFLTPSGLKHKARLTMEFLDFSMQFYREARRRSAQLCRELSESGVKRVAFLGTGELAEITYIGVREWGLELVEVFAADGKDTFLDLAAKPVNGIANTNAEAIIVCTYDAKHPTTPNFLPESVAANPKLRWIFHVKTA